MKLEEKSGGGKPFAWVVLALAASLVGIANAFAEANLAYIYVSTQSPSSIQPGQRASYTVTANKTGNGSLDVYCSVAGLPTGTTVSFSPGEVIKFPDGGPAFKSATMTISTTTATPPGVYPLVITGKHGNGSKSVSCTGTLVISGVIIADLPQRIAAIDCQAEGSVLLTCSGRGGHTYLVQCSPSLNNGSWVDLGTATADANGWFNYTDGTAPAGYSCRFYRTVSQ